MSFVLNPQKAIEATAALLRMSFKKTMGRKRLLALLYLADRLSYARTERPIIGGRIVAMKYGPIHSEVYDFIKGGRFDQAEWSKHFENTGGHLISMVNDPGTSALSRYEIALLNELSDQYSNMGEWDVADATHLADWKATYKEGTSTTIPLEVLLDAIGKGTERDEIVKDAEEKSYFDQLFAGR